MDFSVTKFGLVLALGIFILSGTAILPASHALEIRVKEEATVRGDTITLGDIASFHPNKDARVDRLSRIDVASAPSPGSQSRLNKRFLNYKIGSAIANKEDVRLKVPGSLLVKRTAQFMGSSQLKEIFKEHVRTHSSWPAEKITFDKITTPRTLALPEGELRWEVWGRGNPHYIGNVALTVGFWVDGKQIRKVSLSGKVGVRQETVRAARKIKRRQVIGKNDLILIAESTNRLRKDALSSLEEIIGKRAARSIQSGQVITSRMVEDTPLVEKGKRVIIRAQNESIRITTFGKVLEDGRAGDQVRVINISSGKELFATVKGPGLVEVAF